MRSLFAAALLTVSGTAAAVPITYDFSGTVDSFFQGRLPVPAGLGAADILHRPITGSVTYDDSAPDQLPGDSIGGRYDAILRFSALINGFEFTYDRGSAPAGSSASLLVVNFDDKFSDNAIVFMVTGLQPDFLRPFDSGHEFANLLLHFHSDDPNALSSDALPVNLPAPGPGGGWGFDLTFSDPAQPFAETFLGSFNPRLTRQVPTTVPEPAPLALLALGFGAWIACRRLTRERMTQG